MLSRILEADSDWRRDLVDHSQDLLCVHDLQGHLLAVNPGPARVLGYTVEEILQIPMRDMIVPEFREQFDAYLQEVKETGESRGFLAVMTRTGKRRIWQYHNTLRTEGVPSPVVRGIAHDVTEQKQAESALRTSESRLRALFEKSPVGICVIESRSGRLLKVNRKFCEIVQRSEEVLLRSEFPDVCLPDDLPSITQKMRELASGSVQHFELQCRLLRSDRSIRWARIAMVRTSHDGESPASSMAIAQDITESREAEIALRSREAHFRLLIEQASDGVFVSDPLGRYLDVNSAGANMLGYTRDEILRLTIADVVAEHEVPRVEPEITRLTGGTVTRVEWQFRRKDGSLFPGEVAACQLPDGRLQAIVRDITERKRAEEAVATIVKQVRGESSEAFFPSMAYHLAKCLSADHTIIGELVAGDEEAVRTIGVCSHGCAAPNFTYRLADTPCAQLPTHGTCVFPAGAGHAFPNDTLLHDMQIEGYIGTPLFDSQHRAIGLIAALYSRPIPNPAFAIMILQLFSARTGAEIERKRSEQALRQSEERLRVALKHSGLVVFHQDRDLRYTWLHNPVLAWAEQDALGKTDADILGPSAAANLTRIKQSVLETGIGTHLEVPILHAEKQYYFDLTIEPLIQSDGSVTGLTCAAMDITPLREANEELRRAQEKLQEEKVYLEQEIHSELGFEEIVGTSDALKSVMQQVGKVASSDSTVLLLGETGTGKELIARALHRMSSRNNHPFIKMNCAAIPAGLLESELFGHERGAFTGALAKKVGRLELADKGTLFLDEIGEVALALQPKLLRVLQDQEFERLGGLHTLKVNFRLIAATNRNLFAEVQKGQFRSDLFYRLSVFPIRIPPLRERRADIPLLAEHFVHQHAQRMKKAITSIPKASMDALLHWDWPGNVRELENFMERSVILTQGPVLAAPIAELVVERNVLHPDFELPEREKIVRALERCGGQLAGPEGAAALLGISLPELQAKLSQLGIDLRRYRAG